MQSNVYVFDTYNYDRIAGGHIKHAIESIMTVRFSSKFYSYLKYFFVIDLR